mmetsp:Transcript_20390/g.56513  ORF Transcript_20390/g.56513 Transcript_20390/m.56513 type:complete len:394 (+) Transcript_20390:212-1393(+)
MRWKLLPDTHNLCTSPNSAGLAPGRKLQYTKRSVNHGMRWRAPRYYRLSKLTNLIAPSPSPGSVSNVRPMTDACGKPMERSSWTAASACSIGKVARMPPAVWGSTSTDQYFCFTRSGAFATICFTALEFSRCSDDVTPAEATSLAPSSSGTAAKSISTQTWFGFAISTRWPRRPKPVTSVQAVTPCFRRHSTAEALDSLMLLRAPITHLPCALRCMWAAMMAPVPRPLVRTTAWFAPTVALWMMSSSLATPSIENPRAISAPSPEWPPTKLQPAALRTSRAPAIIWKSTSSTFEGAPYGTTGIARAVLGLAPIAWQSPSAWLAAMQPNTYGSPTKSRKKSTVRTLTIPGPGLRTTAASSGESSPTTTSSDEFESMCPASLSLDMTWERTLAPT